MTDHRYVPTPTGIKAIRKSRKKQQEQRTEYPVKPEKSPAPKEKKVATEKICTSCQKNFPISEFMTKSGKHKYSRCLTCRRILQKSRMRMRLAFDPSTIRHHLITHMGGKCARCNYDEFIPSLEFHHRNRLDKSDVMTRLINRFAYSGTPQLWEKLVAEARKCIILCSNCHQALHHGCWQLTLKMMFSINNIPFIDDAKEKTPD